MSNNSELNTFPKNLIEALAFLYVQNQNLSGKPPAEIYRIYKKAAADIQEAQRADLDAKWNQL
jgi:hypothetical protein